MMAVAMAVAMAAGGGDHGSGSSVWLRRQLTTAAVKDVPFLRLSSTLPAAEGRATTAAGGRATTVAGGEGEDGGGGKGEDSSGGEDEDSGARWRIFPSVETLPPLSAILTMIGDCTDSYVKSYREISYIGAEIFYIK